MAAPTDVHIHLHRLDKQVEKSKSLIFSWVTFRYKVHSHYGMIFWLSKVISNLTLKHEFEFYIARIKPNGLSLNVVDLKNVQKEDVAEDVLNEGNRQYNPSSKRPPGCHFYGGLGCHVATAKPAKWREETG